MGMDKYHKQMDRWARQEFNPRLKRIEVRFLKNELRGRRDHLRRMRKKYKDTEGLNDMFRGGEKVCQHLLSVVDKLWRRQFSERAPKARI